MIVGVPKELYPGERRVALTPVVVPMLAKAGLEVVIEAGAGERAGYPDAQYQDKGAKILSDRNAIFAQSDIVVQVLSYGANDKTGSSDLQLMRKGQVLCSVSNPIQTIRWRSNSPVRISGVCGESTSDTAQIGFLTPIDSVIWTLSKFTKRKSG